MFKPNFIITNKIARYLSEIAEARAIILNAPLIPKWEVDLRRKALISSTHASTSIEGNRLSLEEVSDLMIGREITASARDKKEVLNYFEALNHLDTLAKQEKIAEEGILDLHQIITQNVLDNSKDSGRYRTTEEEKRRGRVVVAERTKGGLRVTFTPPPAKDVPQEMERFVCWLNSEQAKELDPILKAGIAHYELVRIHPFVDGNGRTARILASMLLLRQSFDTKRFFTLDDFYNSDRKRYYEALKSVSPETQDLTEWLEYFSEGVAVSIKAVKDKVLALTGGKEREQESKQVPLDYKQVKVVEFLRKEGRVTNRQVQELLGVSHQTAYEVLQGLTENGVIMQVGRGRAVHYVLG